MKKQVIGLVIGLAMSMSILTGCDIADYLPVFSNTNDTVTQEEALSVKDLQEEAEKNEDSDAVSEAEEVLTCVRILNDDVSQQDAWQKLADAYEKEKGVSVEVVDADASVYRDTFAEYVKQGKPATIFMLENGSDVSIYEEFCADLGDADFYKEIINQDLGRKNKNGEITAAAISTDYYGLIYNKTIMNAYISMKDAKIQDVSELNSFETLTEVAKDVQKRAGELKKQSGYPVKGAFASSSMDNSSVWRFSRMLMNYALYYEKQDGSSMFTKGLKGKYLDEYKAMIDLMLENTCCDEDDYADESGGDAVKEFAAGEALFYFGGDYSFENILGCGKLSPEQLGMTPLCFGVADKDEGLGLLNTKYICVNKEAKERDKEAAFAFLDWCVKSQQAQEILHDEMGYSLPYSSAQDFKIKNTLTKEAFAIASSDKRMICDVYELVPSREWEKGLAKALREYSLGESEWDAVQKAFDNHD